MQWSLLIDNTCLLMTGTVLFIDSLLLLNMYKGREVHLFGELASLRVHDTSVGSGVGMGPDARQPVPTISSANGIRFLVV